MKTKIVLVLSVLLALAVRGVAAAELPLNAVLIPHYDGKSGEALALFRGEEVLILANMGTTPGVAVLAVWHSPAKGKPYRYVQFPSCGSHRSYQSCEDKILAGLTARFIDGELYVTNLGGFSQDPPQSIIITSPPSSHTAR